MGIDTTDNTDTTTPQEGSSMSDSRDEAIEAGAHPIPPIPFSQMTVDGKLVHAITTNSHGITRLRKYSDSLADTIGEVRREYREWEERLKGMRIELTPEEEHPSAMLERLGKLEAHFGTAAPVTEAVEFIRKKLHEVTVDGEGRGNRILELAIRATALEEGIGRGDDHAARISELEGDRRDMDKVVEHALEAYDVCEAVREVRNDFLRALDLNADDIPGLHDLWVRVGELESGDADAPLSLAGMDDEVARISTNIDALGVLVDGKVTWDDLDERIETRMAGYVTDDYLGEWMGDNGYVHESNFGDAITEHIDISEISSQVQENLDMDDLAYEVQNNFDMCSLAEEVRENMDLGDAVASAMAEHGCRVLKENPAFADELCEMVLASAESALDRRIDDALQEAVLDGLRRVTSIPAFQEATMLHLRMDELAKSVESVRSMVRDLEHF